MADQEHTPEQIAKAAEFFDILQEARTVGKGWWASSQLRQIETSIKQDKKIALLLEAVEPFAKIAEARDRHTLDWLNTQGPGPHNVADYQPDTDIVMTDGVMAAPLVATLGDLRRALAAREAARKP